MKFNVKFGPIHKKNLTSGEVRKVLTKEGKLTVKKAKEPISHAIKCFFADRRTFEVAGQPHVEVVKESVDKKILEMHKNMVQEKQRNREESEQRARDQEVRDAIAAKKLRKQATV
jgi:hypothetical protein